MKLNLLPTSVTREKTARRAWVVTVLMSLVSIGLSIMMIVTSRKALDEATAAALEVKPKAEQVQATAAQADTIIGKATPFMKNVALVKAIDDHTKVYPEFYAKLMPYLPDFFRIYSMTATPLDAGTVSVQMEGVIKNQVMYNDLMFALLRIPGVQGISRSPITTDWDIVPNLTPDDKVGRIHKQSEPTIPDDAMNRLNLYLGRGGTTAYLNQGNFGSGLDAARLNMPKWNQVTVAFTMPGNLQAPNIRAALGAGGGGGGRGGGQAAGFGQPGGGGGSGGARRGGARG